MSVFWRKNRSVWAYNFNYQNQRYAGYCTHPDTGKLATSKTEAEHFEALIRDKVIQSQGKLVRVGTFTLVEALSFYLEKMQGRATFKNLKTYAREVLEYFGAECPLHQLEQKIPAYTKWALTQPPRHYVGKDQTGKKQLAAIADKTRSPKAINEYLRFIETACRAFQSAPENYPVQNLIPAPPRIEYLKVLKRTPTPIPVLSIERLLTHCTQPDNLHLRAAVIIAFHTGMREKECTVIREHQYMESERIIILHPEQTKARTGRFVHINESCHEALMECRLRGDELWQDLQADPKLKATYAAKYRIVDRADMPFLLFRKSENQKLRPVKNLSSTGWDTLREKAGVNYRWHDLRAAFCTRLLATGASIEAVKTLAGHQSILTTQAYISAGSIEMRRAVESLDKSDHKIRVKK